MTLNTRRGVRVGLLALALSIASIAAAAEPAPGARPVFSDVTDEAGIRFRHSFGDHDLTNIVEGTGSGAMFFDYDGDGNLDIYFVNGAWTTSVNDNRGRDLQGKLANVLYRSAGDGTFRDVTGQAGVGDKGYGFGCSAGDFDRDGDLDLYVLNYGPNVFYRNNGDGTFTDISAKSGLADGRWSLSAPWLDYDNDGDLDVYVANYLAYDAGKFRSYYAAAGYPGPLSYSGQPDALYRNNGDGTFTDVTERSGVYNAGGRAMSAVAADINNDGYLDIFVANDAMENYYYQNNGKGGFKNKALLSGLAYGEYGQGVSSMGPVLGDVDHDGRLDIFIPDMGYGSLLINRDPLFVDQITTSKLAVICGQYTGWGGILFDYDNDRDLDLFVTNGNAHHEYTEEDVLAANDGKGVFVDVAAKSGKYFGEKFVGRGSTYGDYDNDGDLDILIVNLNDRAKLLRNDGGNRNHWLQVEAKLPGGKLDAIGARVTVKVGETSMIRDVVGVMGYLSQGDPRVHFGLGRATKADAVEIRWPDRSVQRLGQVKADQMLRVVQGAK
jgi:hypothetical protein